MQTELFVLKEDLAADHDARSESRGGTIATMSTLEIDHLFVFSQPDAPEAEELRAAGFQEGSPNTHAGQGTACRRFFFENAMLEFLYVVDLEVTRSGSAARTGLAQRWEGQGRTASPFGLCFRPSSTRAVAAPFRTWTYGPKYLPNGLPSYEISARCEEIAEPFIFYMPYFTRPDRYPPERAQPLTHACGARTLTSVELVSPLASIADLEGVASGELRVAQAPTHHLCVTFDRNVQQRSLTLSTLPLTLKW